MLESGFFLGAEISRAAFVFLLPNKPMVSDDMLERAHPKIGCAEIVALNGNHWRKILTIIAKLTSPRLDDWRSWRDEKMLNCVSIVFDMKDFEHAQEVKFIVGNTFRDKQPVPNEARVFGKKQLAYQVGLFYWCPYLDYRQFPNVLVDELRGQLHKS